MAVVRECSPATLAASQMTDFITMGPNSACPDCQSLVPAFSSITSRSGDCGLYHGNNPNRRSSLLPCTVCHSSVGNLAYYVTQGPGLTELPPSQKLPVSEARESTLEALLAVTCSPSLRSACASLLLTLNEQNESYPRRLTPAM